MKIEGTAAVVTGGASGLGEATARALAAKGAKVAVFDRDADKGEKVAAEIGGIFCEVDVMSDDKVAAAFDKARAAHGQHHRRLGMIGRVERALIILEAGRGGPVEMERLGGLAQAADGKIIGFGHHPEQSGVRRQQGICDGKVGGERQSGVTALRHQSRAEGERIAPLARRGDFLLGWVDARRPARCFGRLNPPRQFGEPRGQIGVAHRIICKLGAAADQRALGAVEADLARGVDPHREHYRRARPVGEQAGGSFAQRGRIKTRLAIGEVQRRPPPPCLGVDHPAIVDEPGDVGDRVVEDEVLARGLDRKRLVEVGRACRVECHERLARAVAVRAGDSPGSLGGGGEDFGREALGHLILQPDRGQPGGERVSRIVDRFHRACPTRTNARRKDQQGGRARRRSRTRGCGSQAPRRDLAGIRPSRPSCTLRHKPTDEPTTQRKHINGRNGD